MQSKRHWARSGNEEQYLIGNNQNKVFVMLPKRIYQTKCSENLLSFPVSGLVKTFPWVIQGSVVQDLKSKEAKKHGSSQHFHFLGL